MATTMGEIAAKEEAEFRSRLSKLSSSEKMAVIGEEIAVQLMWIRAELAEIETTVQGK